jgi:hypothetical protein
MKSALVEPVRGRPTCAIRRRELAQNSTPAETTNQSLHSSFAEFRVRRQSGHRWPEERAVAALLTHCSQEGQLRRSKAVPVQASTEWWLAAQSGYLTSGVKSPNRDSASWAEVGIEVSAGGACTIVGSWLVTKRNQLRSPCCLLSMQCPRRRSSKILALY